MCVSRRLSIVFRNALALSASLLAAAFPVAAHAQDWEAISFKPDAYNFSQIRGISADGKKQVGYAYNDRNSGFFDAALLWNGSANDYVNLTPPGSPSVVALAISADGTRQLGSVFYDPGLPTNHNDIALWTTGTSGYVNLNPGGWSGAVPIALSADGEYQGGTAVSDLVGEHALLWHGTADSLTDLHPSDAQYKNSATLAISAHGEVQGGRATYKSDAPNSTPGIHALMWRGTAASAVDLNPVGSNFSQIFAVSGDGLWLGGNFTSPATGTAHAALWRSDTAVLTDIHPAGYSSSLIRALSPSGEWAAGLGTRPGSNVSEAIIWHLTGATPTVYNLSDLLPADHGTAGVWSVNDRGDVGGTANVNGSGTNAYFWRFLGTAVAPEPASGGYLALGVVSLGLVGFVRTRRGRING